MPFGNSAFANCWGLPRERELSTYPDVAVRRDVDLDGNVIVLLVVVLGEGRFLGRESNDVLLVVFQRLSFGRRHDGRGCVPEARVLRAGAASGGGELVQGEFRGVADSQLPTSFLRPVEYFLGTIKTRLKRCI